MEERRSRWQRIIKQLILSRRLILGIILTLISVNVAAIVGYIFNQYWLVPRGNNPDWIAIAFIDIFGIVILATAWFTAKEKRPHPFVFTGTILVLIAVIAITFAVIQFGWDWTGFNGGYSKITIHTPAKDTELPQVRTLWDWLGLTATFAIPLVVGFGAVWFTIQQGKVSAAENTDNQREVAFQGYIDKISELLLHEKLRDSAEEDEVRKIARVRTLTILPRLDPKRKRSVIQFLYESALIDKDKTVINLDGADLSQADLYHASLNGANLSGTDLSDAKLTGANLNKANLFHATFIGADLLGSDMTNTNMRQSSLYNADLRGTNLTGADLQGANFSEADLSGANLKQATGITIEELEKQAKSLQGATMPEGSKHP